MLVTHLLDADLLPLLCGEPPVCADVDCGDGKADKIRQVDQLGAALQGWDGSKGQHTKQHSVRHDCIL